MIDRDHGRELGERQKQLAFELLEMNRADYVLAAQRALLRAVLANGVATADDVRDAVELPPGINPKLFGSVPGPLAKAGVIRRDGFDVTCRPAAHARPVSRWVIADPVKAFRWLQTNKPAEPAATGTAGDSTSL